MKNLYSLGLLTLVFASSFAQEKGNIRGALIDTAMKQPVGDATITVMKASDSSLVSFSRSNSKGDFTVGYLDNGKYRVLITHVTYKNVSRFFEINETTKSVDLGYIPLTNKTSTLDTVQVVQEAAPVTMKNDTVEYNAGSFKTKPNAVVEDLLKKLPGVQVDKDGKIKANGEEVKKVLVDGKQFFGNDPKTATKNLPADVVDKVQVFDKKSDQSQFTGFDDGNSEKTINLTIKPNKKNGVFGKATAGGGTEGRYQGNFNINEFSGDRQISAIGMANNTNKQGFSFMDILNFSGGLGAPGGKGGQIVLNTGGLPMQGSNNGNNGLTTTWAGGLNFNDTYNKKVEVNGSYFYNRLENDINQKVNREYLIPGNSFTRVQESIANMLNENHRFNFMSDYKIDSMNSLKYTTAANVQEGSNASQSLFSSIAPKGYLLNDGSSSTNTEGNGYSWDNNLLWRHKFNKKGRTFSGSFTFNATEGNTKSLLNSLTKFYQPDGSISDADTIDQVNKQNMQSRTYRAIASYTEPLSRKSLLEFNYNFNQNNSNSGTNTYDLDPYTGKDPVKNELLSNDFVNHYQSNQGGVSWRYQDGKYNISVGNFIQAANMQTDFHFVASDSSLHKQFLNYLPTARFQYAINKYRNLRFDYNTSTQAPSAIQLNPIVDVSDPLNIRVGNPNLSQEYTHRLTFHYLSFDPFRRTSFFSMLNYSATSNRIVNYDQIDSQGVRKTSYINVDGVYTLLGALSWGLPVRPIKSNLNLNTNIVQSKNINFINKDRNIINSLNVTQEVSLNFVHKEILDLTAGANVSYNRVRYSLPGQNNVNYWNQEYSLDMNVYFPHGISLASEFSFNRNTGYAEGYNTDVALWNVGLAKQLFKNKKGEIKAQVFDILNQNVGITRNANQNYIEDVQTKILSRYFLLSFTYNLNRFAGKSVPKMQNGNIKIIGEKTRM